MQQETFELPNIYLTATHEKKLFQNHPVTSPPESPIVRPGAGTGASFAWEGACEGRGSRMSSFGPPAAASRRPRQRRLAHRPFIRKLAQGLQP